MVTTVNGQKFVIVGRRVVRGCCARFDGRVLFVLRRVGDGAVFSWMGGRTSRTVPTNARLSAKPRRDGA
jgi:hypothetical protein